MNSDIETRPPIRVNGQTGKLRRSGAVAALLSFIFPGLGQAYLGDRRMALAFSLPVVLLIAFAVVALSVRGAAFRLLDPSVSLVLLAVIVALGLWWIAGVWHAWRGGWHAGTASVAVVVLLILTVGAADVWGAVQVWRVHNASEEIFSGDPLDETPPPPTPSPSPTPVGETPNPAATPTQRPPDYNDPSDDPNEPDPTIQPGATPSFDITQIDAHNDGLLNILLVGLDWQPGRTSKRTDTILVVSANSDTGEVLMFSFPRDIARFELYEGGLYNGKINTFAGFANRNPELFPEGGLRSLAYQVGFLLGIPIDYYASVNMPGFMSVVDVVGGVNVTNTRDISDGNLQFYLPPGDYRLNPADALRYVRTRKGSGGDFGRAERQQQILAGLRREFLKPQNVTKLPEIVEALSEVINTDFPPGQIDQLVQLAEEVEAEPSQSWIFKNPEWAIHLPARETNGRSVIFLKMDKIAQLSIDLFGEKSLYFGRPLPKGGIPDLN